MPIRIDKRATGKTVKIQSSARHTQLANRLDEIQALKAIASHYELIQLLNEENGILLALSNLKNGLKLIETENYKFWR